MYDSGSAKTQYKKSQNTEKDKLGLHSYDGIILDFYLILSGNDIVFIFSINIKSNQELKNVF